MPDFKSLAVRKTNEQMESIQLTAAHSGAIDHAHSFHFDSGVITTVKEIRLAITVLVGGWVVVQLIRSLEGTLKGREG